MNFAATNLGVLKRLCKDGAESRMEAKTAWKVDGPIMSYHVATSAAAEFRCCPTMLANHSETQALAHTAFTYPVQCSQCIQQEIESSVSMKFNFREVFCLVAVFTPSLYSFHFFPTFASALTTEAQPIKSSLPHPHSLVVRSGI